MKARKEISVKKRSKGVTIFGILLIVSSLWELKNLADFNYYLFLFQQLPEQAIRVRYFGSITLRMLGLVSGIGILGLRNIFRKIAISLNWFTILTIYWKHPIYTLRNIYKGYLEQIVNIMVFTKYGPNFPIDRIYEKSLLVASTFLNVVDLVFAFSLIYFFTRPTVKQQFLSE
jgi:hypothetical protein